MLLSQPKLQKEVHPHVKREDVDLIVRCLVLGVEEDSLMTTIAFAQVHELEIPRQAAEQALAAADGDIVKALENLIS